MFKIGILDADVLEQQSTRLIVQTWLGEKGIANELFFYDKPEDLGDNLNVLITEIAVNDEFVFDRLSEVRQRQPLLSIIFVTEQKGDRIRRRAQDIHSFAYVLKHESERKLPIMLNDAYVFWENILKAQESGRVSLKTTRHYLSLPKEDILYFKFSGRRTVAVTKNQTYVVQHTLKELGEIMGEGFSFSHRSCLVNLDHVRVIFGVRITLDNDEKIVLSQKRGKSFRSAMKEYAARLGRPSAKKPRAKNRPKEPTEVGKVGE